MKKIAVIIVLILVSFSAKAQNIDTFFKQADAFLSANVTNGKVDYDAINKNPKALIEVLQIAEGISVSKSDAINNMPSTIFTYFFILRVYKF